METNKIYQGDCLEVLKTFPDESVDFVFTDPPYMISKTMTIRRSRNPMKYKYVGKDISFEFGDWDIFENEEEYFKFVELWFKECARVLKKSGHIVVFFDKWKVGDLVRIGKKYNINGRQPLFLIKSNPVPCARKVGFMNAIEMAYWGTKFSEKKTNSIFNYKIGQHPDYMIVPITKTPRDRERHPCEKNPKWIEWVMKYFTNEGDLVLDCFAGTGVVGEVALKLGRKFILIEKDEKWVDVTKKRLAQYLEQTKLNIPEVQP